MATYYNPRVVTSNLKVYFDSLNPKSYISGNLYSMLGSETIITWANTFDGFIQSNGVQSSATQLTSIQNANSLTIVVSIKANTLSKGTAFSLYGDRSSLYVGSSLSNTQWSISNSNATSTVSLTSNTTGNTLLSNVIFSGANSNALATVALTHRNNANAALTNVGFHSANSAALSTEIAFDIPDHGISVYLDYDSIGARYKSNNYNNVLKSSYNPSLNDIVTVVYKSTANNMTIYLNRDLMAQSNVDTNTKIFGTNLSLTNINGQGSPSNFPIRSLLMYDRELSQEEISQIANAIRKI